MSKDQYHERKLSYDKWLLEQLKDPRFAAKMLETTLLPDDEDDENAPPDLHRKCVHLMLHRIAVAHGVDLSQPVPK